MKQFYPLSTFLTEYSEKNGGNTYRPVAVGRYGIRTRESIYSKELAKDYSKNKLIHKNTLTVGMGSVQIDIGVLTDDITYSVSPAYHTYNIAGVNAEYLRYCLECRNQDMFSRFVKRGSRQGKTIDLKRWLTYEIPVYDENRQQEIVDRLNRISELIEKRQEQLIQLSELVKSRFIELFGLYPSNPKGWKTATIRDIVTDVRYGSSRPAVDGGKYPYLRMNNITYGGELDLTDTKRIDIPDNEVDKCTVRRGDVLFNRTNSKELVGKTCVYNRDEMMVLAGFVIRVRVTERVLPEFLSAFLNTDFSKQMLLGMCKAAIGQANINAQEMQNIGIYLPPTELQRQFVQFKEQTDKSKYYSSLSYRYCQAAANTYRQEWMTCRTSDF
jgi:type I restriction enzyme S subunit